MAVVAYGLAWMAGVMGGVGEAFNSDVLRAAGTVARLILPSDVLWRGSAGALSPSEAVLRSAGVNTGLYKFSPFSGSHPEPALAGVVRRLDRRRARGRDSLLRRREL